MLDTGQDVLITEGMILTVLLASLADMQTVAVLAMTGLGTFALAWWLQQQKQVKLQAVHQQALDQSAVLLEQEKAESAKQAAQARKSLDEAIAERVLVEERFATHREAAERRESELLARIASLESDLAETREIAARLAPTEARVGDLETTLRAERGRVAALEQTLQVTTDRAREVASQLLETQNRLTQHLEKTRAREAELVQQLADQEQILAVDQARLGTVDEEISRLKETQAAYQATAENRITGLQRQLAAAEAKAALVQKEFMSAVGVLPEPSAATMAAPNDKRVQELESKLTQAEAEARKKAREDGYRIAELEYRLTEAKEALAGMQAPEAGAAETESLREEVKKLTAEKAALADDLETLKMVKARSVEPVPEVLEQGFLLMDDDLPGK